LEVNLSHAARVALQRTLAEFSRSRDDSADADAVLAVRNGRSEIEEVLKRDSFPRFLQSEEYL
jgi:hypothetical protein